jgi:hypothetical protein
MKDDPPAAQSNPNASGNQSQLGLQHYQQALQEHQQDTLRGNSLASLPVGSYLDQPQFIIKKGKVLDTQQEFVAFKKANITKWGAIQ